MKQHWYKNAIFYSLDVETYYDSNGDGIGDFQGLIQKLDNIAAIGAQCIWLLPFYPSPNRDNGYDVMDYYNIDPRLGTLGDFAQFISKAEQLGLRVIIDLVVNHSSIDHPWFQEARADRKSPYRDYYVWADEPIQYPNEDLMFQGEEDTLWTFDEVAQQYYLHRFYKSQPDLNLGNPKVKTEILKIISFWLRLGIHGFRIDAAEIMVEPFGLKGATRADLMHFFNEMRDHVQAERTDALLLAEVNAGPDEMQEYLQGDKRMHMLFNFFVNQHLFLAIGSENKQPLVAALEALPPLGEGEQWLHFLRHHDELNLRLLSEDDRQKVFEEFAPEPEMRIYGFGIRRRLAAMMDGALDRLKLSYSLLYSMPGTQLIRYGDEIGMGDDLSLEGRSSVRTVMQWSPEKAGGFSTASETQLVQPVIGTGPFGYKNVNVVAAQQDKESLLNWLEQLILTRKQCPEIGFGKLFICPYADDRVLIHGYEWEERKVYFVHNFSNSSILLHVHDFTTENAYDLFGSGDTTDEGVISLAPFDYRWYRTG